MQLTEAVKLIQHAIPQQKMLWADLGCGDGFFTNALSHILSEGSIIYAVDKNKRALNNVTVQNSVQLEKLNLNFVNDILPFKNLSGILMANALHFVKNKDAFINSIFNCLAIDGYLLLVEYDTDTSNIWVPYPISFNKLKKFFESYNGKAEKLNEIKSRFGGKMYSAIVRK